jgi:hypothetical protein
MPKTNTSAGGRVPVSVSFSRKQLEETDKLAEGLELTRSDLIHLSLKMLARLLDSHRASGESEYSYANR